MQEVFEKIIQRLELESRYARYSVNTEGIKSVPTYKAIEIVKKEVEKFGTDTNVGSNGWIPCSERLPEEDTTVIACFSNGLVTELVFYNGIFHGTYGYTEKMIIAWQPLPQPYQPKGE